MLAKAAAVAVNFHEGRVIYFYIEGDSVSHRCTEAAVGQPGPCGEY
jgi:hypothetical protein